MQTQTFRSFQRRPEDSVPGKPYSDEEIAAAEKACIHYDRPIRIAELKVESQKSASLKEERQTSKECFVRVDSPLEDEFLSSLYSQSK